MRHTPSRATRVTLDVAWIVLLLVFLAPVPATSAPVPADLINADGATFPPGYHYCVNQSPDCYPGYPPSWVYGNLVAGTIMTEMGCGGVNCAPPAVEFRSIHLPPDSRVNFVQRPSPAGGVTCQFGGGCTGRFRIPWYANKGGLRGRVRDQLGNPVGADVPVMAVPDPGDVPPSVTVYTRADGSYDFTDWSCAGWLFEQMCRDHHWALLLDGVYGDPGPMRWPYTVRAGGVPSDSPHARRGTVESSWDLEIDLTIPLGLEEPDRCESGGDGRGPSAPRSTGKPVDIATGNMYFDQTDVSIPVLGPPLAFTRSYNSNKVSLSSGPAGFGPGWRSSYSRTLTLGQVPGAPGTLVLRQDDGVALYFVPGAGNSFTQAYPWNQQNTLQDEGATYRRVFRAGGHEIYDKTTGRLLEVADRRGQRTLLAYDAQGRLETITDEDSERALTLGYESWTSSEIATLTGPMGLIATYGYDGSGRLQSVTYADGPADDDGDPVHDNDPDGGYTFEYAGVGGRLSRITDLTGRVVEEHDYHPDGRARTSALAGDVELLTLDYDSEPFRTKVASRRTAGQEPPDVTTYEWQSFWGQRKVTKIIGPCSGCGGAGGDVQEWTYDTHGRVRFYKDGAGNITEYVYDEATGDLVEERKPLGHTTLSTYYPDGRLHTRTDPNGRVTTWTHNETQPEFVDTVTETVDDAVPPQVRTTVHTYWPNGRLKSIQDPRGKLTSFTYDPATGDLLTSTDPLGNATPGDPNDHVTHFEHDALGRRTAVVDPMDHRTETAYNTRGQVVKITRFKDGGTPLVSRFFYDMAGRRTKARDPLSHVTDYIYDTSGRLWKVKPPSEMKPANSPTTLYEYDLMSNLWKLTDAEGRTTTFTRDGHGRVTKVTYPGPELREEHYTYDGAGRLATRTDRRGIVTTYAYDALGRLTGKTYPPGKGAPRVFRYDENGDKGFMTSADNGDQALSWDYDLAGQVRRESASADGGDAPQTDVNYQYDLGGNRSSLTFGAFALAYDYDDASRLERIWRGSNDFAFEYYDNHQRDTLTLPNGAVTDWGYDALGQLTSLTTTLNSATLASSTYTYDNAGNRITKSHPDFAETYGYDMEYRLTQVLRGTSPSETYTYDKVGNRKTSITYPTWQYNPRNELTSYGPYTLTYDQNGNLASKTGNGEAWTYDWNAENELTAVGLNGNTVASFDYDPLGRRIQKTTANNTWTRWLYDGEDILRRTTSAGDSTFNIHGPGIDEPLAEEVSGTLRYLLTDGLGSVLRVVDGQGADVVPARRYNAFGELEQGGAADGYAYTGREWDPETGLYYYRARYYDPKTGRFISEDPLRDPTGAAPRYPYVANRVATRADPRGEAVSPITVAAIAALIEALLHVELADRSWDAFPDGADDKARHCWVNCVSTRLHLGNNIMASAASVKKEVDDMWSKKPNVSWQEQIQDSIRDLIADWLGQLAALNIFEGCDTQCRRACPRP